MSIRAKLAAFFMIMIVITLSLLGSISYFFSKKNAIEEAKSKAELLFNYLISTRSFLTDVQRPILGEILEKDRFYPELQSGTAVMRRISEIFTKKFPEFQFKQASDNPMVASNAASPFESTIINEFRKNPTLPRRQGLIHLNNKPVYFFAQNMPMNKKCIMCHGDPIKAPKDIQEIYGTQSGYHYKSGDSAGAAMIYVPLQNALDDAKHTALKISFVGAGVLVSLILGIFLYMNFKVFKPVRSLVTKVNEISMGENIEQKIMVSGNDEIGTLMGAVERLRISVLKLIKRG